MVRSVRRQAALGDVFFRVWFSSTSTSRSTSTFFLAGGATVLVLSEAELVLVLDLIPLRRFAVDSGGSLK